jgi:hypothetical protein
MTIPKQPKLDGDAMAQAVQSVNAAGAPLDAAAKQIAEHIAVPALAEFAKEHPALSRLDVARAADYISAALVESLFEGADDDGNVVIQFDDGYLTLPGACRELLQAGIVRYLDDHGSTVAAALTGGK